jgi:hypothetical protein
MAEFIDLCWCCFGLNPTAENFFIEKRLCNAICRTAKFQNIYINIPAKKNLHVNRMVLQNKPNEQTATEVVLLMFTNLYIKMDLICKKWNCWVNIWTLTLNVMCLAEKQQIIPIYNLWLDPTGTRTNDLCGFV